MTRRMARLAWRKRRRRRKVALAAACVLAAALACAALFFAVRARPGAEAGSATGAAEPPQITVRIEDGLEEDVLPLLEAFRAERPDIPVVPGGEECNTVIASSPAQNCGGLNRLLLYIPPLVLKAGAREVTLAPARGLWLSSGLADRRVRELASYIRSGLCRSYGDITFNVAGDIIPGRNVARRMAERGTMYPFEKVAPYLRGADIVFADLECPLSDRFAPPYRGVDFIAPRSTIEGLKSCGINVVSLANNHSTNFGVQAFTDTLELLEAHGIAYAGGGRDSGQAYAPRFVEAGGRRFAFLAYNAISGSINAGEGRPGVAWFDMQPYAPDDPRDMAAMKEAVARAKAEADFVVVGFHWSVEYTQQPSSSMRAAARAACDAGADMVIGSHPHIIQPLEYYNGSLIAYSLGNFVFDQMWAEYTREGFFLRCRLKGDLLTQVEPVPYRICDYCQPNVLEGESGQYLLDRLLSISGIAAE